MKKEVKIKCPNPKCDYEDTLIEGIDFSPKASGLRGRCPNCGAELNINLKNK